jgi:hypothetical protein
MVVNLKLVQTVILMIFSAPVAAKDLCPINEDIEPDMRMTESHFTKENAEAAANKIKGIISGVDKKYEWFTVPNNLKVIEGFILKRDAINAKGEMQPYHKEQFCEFMKNKAWWYD